MTRGSSDPRDDRRLLAEHAAGDREAFAVLVDRHGDRLWAVALRTCGDRDEAADALQDALFRAASRAHTFRGEAEVTTWLHRIVVNAALDRLRRRTTRREVPLEALPDDPPASGDAFAAVDTAATVRAGLAALPPQQAAALVLVDMEGRSVTDAAAILGVAPGTVKSRCARGRARLAVLLGYLRNPDDAEDVTVSGAQADRTGGTR